MHGGWEGGAKAPQGAGNGEKRGGERTGVLDAMMMSLALPWRSAFMVDL